MTVRAVSILLSIWLFVSAFLWVHTGVQFTNTWIVGVAGVAFSLLTMFASGFRYANMLLGLWLFISVFVLPTGTGTGWNNALVGVALFFLSLSGTSTQRIQRPVRTSA
ncbi:MAG: hypothetical protein LBM75_10985 [Myxococcales bacterium]|jgi:hypothetical protein|nr:hypothetical protein [Myxococcales bacterium]